MSRQTIYVYPKVQTYTPHEIYFAHQGILSSVRAGSSLLRASHAHTVCPGWKSPVSLQFGFGNEVDHEMHTAMELGTSIKTISECTQQNGLLPYTTFIVCDQQGQIIRWSLQPNNSLLTFLSAPSPATLVSVPCLLGPPSIILRDFRPPLSFLVEVFWRERFIPSHLFKIIKWFWVIEFGVILDLRSLSLGHAFLTSGIYCTFNFAFYHFFLDVYKISYWKHTCVLSQQ